LPSIGNKTPKFRFRGSCNLRVLSIFSSSFNTVGEKTCYQLCRYLKSIADIIASDNNSTILITLLDCGHQTLTVTVSMSFLSVVCRFYHHITKTWPLKFHYITTMQCNIQNNCTNITAFSTISRLRLIGNLISLFYKVPQKGRQRQMFNVVKLVQRLQMLSHRKSTKSLQ